MTHFSNHQMAEFFKSAYRKKYSSETALLYVTSAIKTAVDNKQETTLVLVDFSAAFDTMNHGILIRRLRLRCGFGLIGGQSASTTTLTADVPQSSVLGPLLFSLYVQHIGDTIRAHGLFFHHYVDDLQIYSHFDLNPSALAAVVQQMEHCLDNITNWWHGIICVWMTARQSIFQLHPSLQLQSLTAMWFELVFLQSQPRDVFEISVSSLTGT